MAELNGMEDRGNIVILAATNRLDSMDPALLRPGRLGDLVLHIPQPGGKAARAVLGRHLPAEIPYAANGEGPAAAREALLDLAVAQLFAHNSDTELADLTLRDGKHRKVRAADLVSGAQLEAIAQSAVERACVRDAEGGPAGVNSADISAAVSDFFVAAPRALTPRNARTTCAICLRTSMWCALTWLSGGSTIPIVILPRLRDRRQTPRQTGLRAHFRSCAGRTLNWATSLRESIGPGAQASRLRGP